MTDSELIKRMAGKSIVLVGIMGSGKSSVGRRLAARLGLEFADADTEIEEAAGMSISEIFATHGEEYFRDGERRVIDRLLKEKQRVLATGGGAFMQTKTRNAIARHGTSIWLKAEHEVLMRRVRKRSHRPLLQSGDPDAVMQKLMDERYPIYATADLTVMSGDGPHEAVVEEIIQKLHTATTRPSAGQASGTAKVHVDLAGRDYDIFVGRNMLANAGRLISELAPRRACAVVTDRNVQALHLATVLRSLDEHAIRHSEFVLEPGEQSKSIEVFSRLCDGIIGGKFERSDLVVALGGGVIGDLAGFSAACIRRGLRFVQIPTTLLAQVDSSVGGKTAINSSHGKNLIGAFHQPALVITDTATLDTLPEREFRAGYAEVVKYGLINDANFFYWLEQNGEEVFARGPALAEAIRISCAAKAAIVARDETEQGDRALLNLGHTFGHALETLAAYDTDVLVHGEGVSIGLGCAARFSVRLGHMQGQDAARICSHLQSCGMPTRVQDISKSRNWTPDAVLQAMYQDKKVSDGHLTFILMREIGQSFIARGIDVDTVRTFLLEDMRTD